MATSANDMARHPAHLARYEFATGFIRGRRVLDAACGVGYGTRMLAEAGASIAVGIDVSPEAIDFASKYFRRRGTYFVQGDVLRIPLAANSFDVVVSFETLEHVQEPGAFLAECRRVLRPNGVLVLSTPNVEALEPGHSNPFHLKEFTVAELRSELSRVFSRVELLGQREVSPEGSAKQDDTGHWLDRVPAAPKRLVGRLVPEPVVWRLIEILRGRVVDPRKATWRIEEGNLDDCPVFVAVCHRD